MSKTTKTQENQPKESIIKFYFEMKEQLLLSNSDLRTIKKQFQFDENHFISHRINENDKIISKLENLHMDGK